MGLRYVRGLREEAAQALVRERLRAPFASIHDLTRRVPELRKDELTTLAEIGALNAIGKIVDVCAPQGLKPKSFGPLTARLKPCPSQNLFTKATRRSNLETRDSQLETRNSASTAAMRSGKSSAPSAAPARCSNNNPSPTRPRRSQPMNHEERLVADFHGTGLTVGPHPMAYRRDWLNAMGIRRASELRDIPNGKRLRIGGCVITRQRPGTAKGFVFFSLEDETGVANAIITPDLFHQNRLLLASERFLAIEGILQNQDNVISVKAERVLPLFVTKAETVSHDFH